MQKIAILGSTGSIGKNSCLIADHLGVQVAALAAHSNIDLLEIQARHFKPECLAVFDEAAARELQKRLPHIPVLAGIEGISHIASLGGVKTVISAMSGFIAIEPTIAAIKAGKRVALANKEVLVAAGAYVTAMAGKFGAELIPVDSEHGAIFQALKSGNQSEVRRLILTASGGPFRTFSKEQLQHVTLSQALRHPSWNMGPKITIDSSTLFNKGLEIIEAHYLFGIPHDKIEVLIHPTSVVHSMVEFCDGSTIAQLSVPDMKLPIQYAITYPERAPGITPMLDLTKPFSLDFFPPDSERFPCLQLAYEALKVEKSMPCFLNAAGEVLVERFMREEIRWIDIAARLEKVMARHIPHPVENYDAIISADREARDLARTI